MFKHPIDSGKFRKFLSQFRDQKWKIFERCQFVIKLSCKVRCSEPGQYGHMRLMFITTELQLLTAKKKQGKNPTKLSWNMIFIATNYISFRFYCTSAFSEVHITEWMRGKCHNIIAKSVTSRNLRPNLSLFGRCLNSDRWAKKYGKCELQLQTA